jgi:flagellar M-ring protein FliF
MKYKAQVEDYLGKKVESMLATVIGAGNAVVRVSADIETEATTRTEEKFDPDGQVVRNQTTTDNKSNSQESHSGGAAVGVAANVPDKATGAPDPASHPTTSTEQEVQNHTTVYEINRTMTNTTRSPGSIKSVTAAVFIAPRADEKGVALKRTEEELTALKQVVVNALGVKPAPGETVDSMVTLREMPFAVEPVSQDLKAIATQNRVTTYLDAASHWGAIAGAAVLLLIFLRLLAKQKPEPIPVEILTLPPEMAARHMPSGGRITPDMVNELIRTKPANVGVALRGWVAANKNN